jgi:ribonuclease P protein component
VPTLGRLVHRADFECLLASPPLWRSAHFVMHYVNGTNPDRRVAVGDAEMDDLSTCCPESDAEPVDKSADLIRLGVVVPKRHARRAVTRNLIRRLARETFLRHLRQLPAGRWLLRLKSPFAPREFVSASSPALASVVRDELERLLRGVARRAAPGAA